MAVTNGTNRSDAVNGDRVDDDCDGRPALVSWMPLAMWLDGDGGDGVTSPDRVMCLLWS